VSRSPPVSRVRSGTGFSSPTRRGSRTLMMVAFDAAIRALLADYASLQVESERLRGSPPDAAKYQAHILGLQMHVRGVQFVLEQWRRKLRADREAPEQAEARLRVNAVACSPVENTKDTGRPRTGFPTLVYSESTALKPLLEASAPPAAQRGPREQTVKSGDQKGQGRCGVEPRSAAAAGAVRMVRHRKR
jgi:hypothetical protein